MPNRPSHILYSLLSNISNNQLLLLFDRANYLFLLDAHPLRTKAVSAALIAAAGDVCAQLIEHHRAAARRKDAINLDGGDGRNGVWGKWKDGFAGFEWNRARTLRLGWGSKGEVQARTE